jgi:hypothetical protein
LRSYGKVGVVERIRSAGGEIYAITSEPQRLGCQAAEEWDLAFETVGDPHHEILGTCRDRALLDLFVNTDTQLMSRMENSIYSHPKGYFQPGVLALATDGRVLYRWRGTPTRKNMGGATERPTAEYVYSCVSDALADFDSSTGRSDADLDVNPKLDSRGVPWPLFVSVLVANGWFIQPRPFGYLKDGPSAAQRGRRALLRIPVFLAAWAAAFMLLPVQWVGFILLGWVAWITPKIRFINRQFQNLPGANP